MNTKNTINDGNQQMSIEEHLRNVLGQLECSKRHADAKARKAIIESETYGEAIAVVEKQLYAIEKEGAK